MSIIEKTTNYADDKKMIKKDGDISLEDEVMVFDPFNPSNREITQTEVENILKDYGLPGKTNNLSLFKRAFIHHSYVKRPYVENKRNKVEIVPQPDDCMSLKTKSNERLEFLGDGVLECITKYYLYRRFPKANEGFMTEKKIAIVKNEMIGRIAYEMGLNKWYIISKSAEEKKVRSNHKKLGCLFEAFLGALFLDMNKMSVKDEDELFANLFVTGPGFQMCQIFIENVFERHINWTELISNDDNYKNIFQVMVQKKFKVTPHYLVINEDEDTGYEVGLYIAVNIPIQDIKPENAIQIRDMDLGSNKNVFDVLETIKSSSPDDSLFVCMWSASHKIKKKAEQECCKMAIKMCK
jgi:dsRNA-specific ribonuclease